MDCRLLRRCLSYTDETKLREKSKAALIKEKQFTSRIIWTHSEFFGFHEVICCEFSLFEFQATVAQGQKRKHVSLTEHIYKSPMRYI
jgi:hypothetical protein